MTCAPRPLPLPRPRPLPVFGFSLFICFSTLLSLFALSTSFCAASTLCALANARCASYVSVCDDACVCSSATSNTSTSLAFNSGGSTSMGFFSYNRLPHTLDRTHDMRQSLEAWRRAPSAGFSLTAALASRLPRISWQLGAGSRSKGAVLFLAVQGRHLCGALLTTVEKHV